MGIGSDIRTVVDGPYEWQPIGQREGM